MTPWTVACQALCPWGFPGKNTGVSCHFLLTGGPPEPGIRPASPVSPALADWFFPAEQPGESNRIVRIHLFIVYKELSKYLVQKKSTQHVPTVSIIIKKFIPKNRDALGSLRNDLHNILPSTIYIMTGANIHKG